jgi:hypothetical protein
MAHAKKPEFVFRRNGRAHLNRRGRQFSRLLAADVCASAVVMLDTPCSEVLWRVLANHSIRQFPLHFPSRESPCAVTFQLDSTSFCTSLQSSSPVPPYQVTIGEFHFFLNAVLLHFFKSSACYLYNTISLSAACCSWTSCRPLWIFMNITYEYNLMFFWPCIIIHV